MVKTSARKTIAPMLWLLCCCGLLWGGVHLLFSNSSGLAQARRSSRVRSWALTPQTIAWDQRVQGLADRTSLEPFLKKSGYPIPQKTFVLATRVVAGVKQPAYVYYSYKNSGFVHSRRQFWPASMVKIWAAVNALITLHKYKLDSLTPIQFTDNYGEFKGRTIQLLHKLDNTNYDRLMRIAGRDNVNDEQMRLRFGLRHTVLQIAYGKGSTLAVSPEIKFWRRWHRWRKFRRQLRGWKRRHFRRIDKIKERRFWRRVPGCPPRANCTTLFEMQDILRRIMLHEELPLAERFPLPVKEMRRFQKAIWRRRHKIWLSTGKVLGWRTRAYGKSGSSSGDSQMDNLFLRSPKGRFLVTLGTPWYREDPDAAPSMIELEELGRHTLRALLTLPQQTAPVQPDAGLPLQASLQSIPCQALQYHITVHSKDNKLKQVKAWVGTQAISLRRKDSAFVGQIHFQTTGEHVIALQGWDKKQPVAYRAFGVSVPAALSAAQCQDAPNHMHVQSHPDRAPK